MSHLGFPALQIYDLPIANDGGWPLFNMHPMAGMMNGCYVEWHLGMVAAGERFFRDAPTPVNGTLRVPDRPGLGLALDRMPGVKRASLSPHSRERRNP